MNALLERIISDRKGHYCHVLEVETAYDLENIAESIISEFQDEYSESTIIEFLESAELYCLNDDSEDEVYSFSFAEYIKDTI